MTEEEFYRESWMTDAQWECCSFIGRIVGGFHCLNGKPKSCGDGITINLPDGRWATFDFSLLTQLVFAAHRECFRVEIASSGPGRLKFFVHKRSGRTGSMYERHPDLEEAIDLHGFSRDAEKERGR